MARQEFTAKVGSCSVSFGLDKRKLYADGYRLGMKYVINGRTLYHTLSWRATEEDFSRISATSRTRGRMSTDRGSDANLCEQWCSTFNAYKERLEQLAQSTTLTIDAIRSSLTGSSRETSFLSLWREVIASRGHGTAASYEIALKSFMRTTRFSEADGFAVTKDTIHRWVQGMYEEGKAKATIGIYLRSCRVVVNEAIRRGYILQTAYPFSEKDADKVSIPRGKSRKHECLTVEQWTQLYDIFMKKDYPEWTEEYKKDTHKYLGLFLFMYLANGLNMADLARLTYGKLYMSGKRCLVFFRQKTKARTDNESEVIVPVTDALQAIIDEQGAEKEEGQLIFPDILKYALTDAERARRVQQENQNCKKHVRALVACLGWTEQPSPTWCRHSFATNLQQQGVPLKYISDAMGHSTGGNVTMGYINDYPIEKQIEYNSLLLRTANEEDEVASMVAKMSEKQRAIMRNLLKT